MKHFTNLLAVAAIILCAACLSACNNPLGPNKNNPVEVTLASADFDITILDHEHGYYRDSNYVFEGVWKDGAFRFGLQKLDPMVPNILPDNKNQIVFKVHSTDGAFEGVNASSSSACINIVQDGRDHTQYHLEWVAEGESTITLWNGTENNKKSISFQVTSKKEIEMTGILYRIGNKTYEAYYQYTGTKESDDKRKGDYENSNFSLPYLDIDNFNELTPIEIIGPIPLNATTCETASDDILYLKTGYELEMRFPDNPEEYKIGRYTDSHSISANGYNKEHYSSYNWFEWHRTEPNAPFHDTPETWEEYFRWFENNTMHLYPCDLRERKIVITKMTNAYGGTFGYFTMELITTTPRQTIKVTGNKVYSSLTHEEVWETVGRQKPSITWRFSITG